MSLSRYYASSWGVGEMLTSAQMNGVDAAIEGALDKRDGYGDILRSVVVSAGAGRIISSVQTGPNSDVTWHPNGGNMIVRVPTLTAARSYTLGHSGATGGDRMIFYVEGTGASPSGYVDIKNNVGTGLFRLGMVCTPTLMSERAQGDNAEFMFVGSGWQLLRAHHARERVIEYTSDAIWICPPGIFSVRVYGCGGGGGGGGGKPNSTADNRWVSGGGGGGGALHHCAVLKTVPGLAYQISIGAGGPGGVASSSGQDGTDSTFNETTAQIGGVVCFPGAAGGATQVTTYGISSGGTYRAHGGAPVSGALYRGWGNFANDLVIDASPSGIASFGAQVVPGSGGSGNGTDTGVAGTKNPFGFYSAGSGGAKGADSGNARGGGGGGGGGAGPFGGGGAGGAGGAGGTPGAGADGGSAAANSGAGGGGGGSGGSAGAGSGAGGAGGNGGSGRIILVY